MFRKMKRLLRLRNKGGFTLIEVIISCALLGILVLGVMGFVTPILSGVREKEQNARAVMLSEAIDSYIANSIQYAFYVQPVTMCASTDTDTLQPTGQTLVCGMKYTGDDYNGKYKDKGLTDLINCLKNDLAGEVFELKCIGMRWTEIPGSSGKKKLMLTNEKVDQETGRLYPNEARLVFDPVFYDGLYPIVKFENYNNQYTIKDDTGTPVNQVDDDKVDIAPALQITAEIYLSDRCYNSAENTRNATSPTFSGITFTEFPQIKSNLLNKGVYKNQPNIQHNSYDEAFLKDTINHASYIDSEGKTYYYGNTFIYYIARKTKTGSDPDTPAPASSSSTSEPDPTPVT